MQGQNTLSRRQALAILAGGATGTVALAAGIEPAAGATVDSIDVSDARYEADDGELYSPWLDLEATYSFETNSEVGDVRAMLLVGPEEDLLDMNTLADSGTSGSGTVPLTAKVIEATGIASSDFDVAEPGQTTTVDIPVSVMVDVRDPDTESLVRGSAKTTVAVTVEHTGQIASVTVGATGSVVFQGNESDPPPA